MTASKHNPIDRPANSVKNLLKALDGFDQGVIRVLQDIKLSTLDNIPQKTQRIWTQSTTTYPHLFPANDCWLKEPPPLSDLILATLDIIASENPEEDGTFNICRRNEYSDADPRIAIAQLLDPAPARTVMLTALRAPGFDNSMMSTPQALAEYVEAYDHGNHQLLLTPKYAHTDIHFDSGDGLSVPIGACEKIWICFPPTVKNLDFYTSVVCRKSQLIHIGKSLEGGVIFRTTSKEAVYLPVGCLHTVFTTVGGFINTLDFVTPDSVKTLAATISRGPDLYDGRHAFEDSIDRFEVAIDLDLSYKRVHLALSSWLVALEVVRGHAEGDKAWRTRVTKVWDRFLTTVQAKQSVCPCGNQGRDFPEHFRAEHLWKTKQKVLSRSTAARPNFPDRELQMTFRSVGQSVRIQEEAGRKRKRGAKDSKKTKTGSRKKQRKR